MVISGGRLVDPSRNAIYVVPAVALSMIVFAYSVRFGQISILAFYGVWFLPALLMPRILLARPMPLLALLCVPALFAGSTFWSDVPAATLRASIQYGTTVFCGLVAARITSVPNLAFGGTIGGLLVLLYSALQGGYSYDYIDGSYAFNGAFASKNQLGYYATLSIMFASSLIWAFRSHALLIPLALATSALGLVMLAMSDSATSLISALAALAAILLVRLLLAFAPVLRRGAVMVVLSGCVVLGVAAYRLGALNALLAAFGRDASLTGRTYLWNQALEFGSGQPVFGIGYGAFWVHGRPMAEQLWEEFYITGRTGFHFHNLLMETYVATGLVGVAMIGLVCLALFLVPVFAILGPGCGGSVILCSGLAMLFLVRSVAEVDFITAYTAGSFLVSFLLLHLVDHRWKARTALRRALAMRGLNAPGEKPIEGTTG